MAQATETRIINHWSLLAFAQNFGMNLATGDCTNHETGEVYKACTFSNGDKRTFVRFGKSLEGGLPLKEIVAQREGLQIVQLEVDAETLEKRKQEGRQLETYALCKKGESAWDSVDLSTLL